MGCFVLRFAKSFIGIKSVTLLKSIWWPFGRTSAAKLSFGVVADAKLEGCLHDLRTSFGCSSMSHAAPMVASERMRKVEACGTSVCGGIQKTEVSC